MKLKDAIANCGHLENEYGSLIEVDGSRFYVCEPCYRDFMTWFDKLMKGPK